MLTFSASGESSQVGFTATIGFQTPDGFVDGGSINVGQQDLTT